MWISSDSYSDPESVLGATIVMKLAAVMGIEVMAQSGAMRKPMQC